jgi:BirA family biotin operon repressor/biotin-[acetyl-CoA-carboxylase] ligase
MAGGDKVGGILAESLVEGDRLVSVVIGSGINLVAPGGLDGAAGVGADVDSTDLLGAFLAAFSDGYRPEADGFAADVIARWTERSATLGRQVAAVDAAGVRIEGIAVGLNAHGGLILEDTDGSRRTVTSDEVVHLR